MSAEKRWRLVCYDIRDPKRYRKVYKILRGVGHGVQYSVFRCRLDAQEIEKLRWQLSRVMAPEDALLVVDLCPGCAGNVISRNHVEGWSEEPPKFRILGRSWDHGPASVAGEGPREATNSSESPGNAGSDKGRDA
jgi:CRISPR-associated protein Cas2